MAKDLPAHVAGLMKYLAQPHERANEDLAVAYFRHLYPERFSRQADAKRADGYVPGVFLLELKGDTNAWFQGLLQGLAYQRELDFGAVVVGAKHFLAAWRVESLPEDIRDAVLNSVGAPNIVGRDLAAKFKARRKTVLSTADWSLGAEFLDLFGTNTEIVKERFAEFEAFLKEGKRVRARITLSNFTSVLQEMVLFFDPARPMKAVRAFYSMIYGWNAASHLELSNRNAQQATLGGEPINDIDPSKRRQFKEFVDRHAVSLQADENCDDFFARYDKALDTVDPDFRVQNGIFFTDLYLSRFVLWLVKTHFKDIGRNYLVLDPACGSGNLVTNWRSPMELRHKVVSEIEPELLFAIERRMMGDAWHHGKFTVVPKVEKNRGLNFLEMSAAEYLAIIQTHLEEKGQRADRPIAFLCNPPYRNDDDQTADSIAYPIHPSIVDIVGREAAGQRYTCFLAQMKEICRIAPDHGISGDSILLIFTKTGWMSNKPDFQATRRAILGSFEQVGGVMVNGREFFSVSGKFPIAFTIWRYRGENTVGEPDRPVTLLDLTWLRREDLVRLPWNSPLLDDACKTLLGDVRAVDVPFGVRRDGMADWVPVPRKDFYRAKTKAEAANPGFQCGMPAGDHRHARRSTLGYADGTFLGFMDDKRPCRIRRDPAGRPWFRLDKPFMDVRKGRCFSGPPDQKGFCPSDSDQAQRMFTWYAMQRTFAAHGYPMWADALDLWPPEIPPSISRDVFRAAFALALAENDCVEAVFPANNPVPGVPEVRIANPMTTFSRDSYWSRTLAPHFSTSGIGSSVVRAVGETFNLWASRFKHTHELFVDYERAYFIGLGRLTKGAGLLQVRDYALETNDAELEAAVKEVQVELGRLREWFNDILLSPGGLNYFGKPAASTSRPFNPKSAFDEVLEKRISLASCFVSTLHDERYFGRTKLAKLFYLADASLDLNLGTSYEREAAGPLDKRALYHPQYGIEALGRKHGYFVDEVIASKSGKLVKYKPGPSIDQSVATAKRVFGPRYADILKLRGLFEGMNTERCEIVATLFASWNDLLLRRKTPTDDDIIDDVRTNWHASKARFDRTRLAKALRWMREKSIVPQGAGRRVSARSRRD